MAACQPLDVWQPRAGGLPEMIVPSPLVGLLVAFEPWFTARRSRTFSRQVAGWLDGLGRRTSTAVAVASGGPVVVRLALSWSPADQPRCRLVDDPRARTPGQRSRLA